MKRRFGCYYSSIQDAEEYLAMIGRNDEIPDFIPGFRGIVGTQHGIGAMFDAVLSADGQVAPTLDTYVKQHGWSDEVTVAFEQLWDKVIAFRCAVWDPRPDNVMVQDRPDGSLHLWLVNGLWERDILTRASLSDKAFVANVEDMKAEMLQKLETIVRP